MYDVVIKSHLLKSIVLLPTYIRQLLYGRCPAIPRLGQDIKSLERYVSEHVLTTLITAKKQQVKEVITFLEDIYGRTRLEKH